MLIEVDFAGDIPIYTQVRDQIVIGIAAGLLLPDEPLPSVRRLAADIGINVHTVNKAYAQLRDEGYIRMDRRSGAEVAPPLEKSPSYLATLETKLYPIVAEAICQRAGAGDICDVVNRVFLALGDRGEDGNE